jgi:hypothetical protein
MKWLEHLKKIKDRTIKKERERERHVEIIGEVERKKYKKNKTKKQENLDKLSATRIKDIKC